MTNPIGYRTKDIKELMLDIVEAAVEWRRKPDRSNKSILCRAVDAYDRAVEKARNDARGG